MNTEQINDAAHKAAQAAIKNSAPIYEAVVAHVDDNQVIATLLKHCERSDSATNWRDDLGNLYVVRQLSRELVRRWRLTQTNGSAEVINKLVAQAHSTAVSKGWWESPAEIGTLLALVHSEISEALEAERKGNPPDDKVPEFSGSVVEMADAIIRIFDICAHKGYPLGEALIAKMQYNEGRSYRHGGKEF